MGNYAAMLGNAGLIANTANAALNVINTYRLQRLKKINSNLEASVAQYQKQLKEIQHLSPKKFEQIEREIFLKFLSQLKTHDVETPLPKANGISNFAIIGEISSGKSSTYNKILGINLEVGVDDTTQKISVVHQENGIVYWDSPGITQQVSVANCQYLKAFYDLDCVFIMTATSFKNVIRTIQVLDKIKPPRMYLVRNQCDNFKSDQELQKAKDKAEELLKKYQIKNVIKILHVSMQRDDNFRDNKKFKQLMKTKF